MGQSLDIRSGLLRVWVVASACWLAISAWHWNREIGYSVQYMLLRDRLTLEYAETRRHLAEMYSAQREDLSRMHLAAMQRFREVSESEYGKAISGVGISTVVPAPDPRIEELDKRISALRAKDQGPPSPQWTWVVGMFAPPISLLLIAQFLARVGGWIWSGFTRSK